jgi:DNA-directed RNA polymerase
MQLLEDHRSGKSQPPSAELWGRVTEGAARLGGEINTKDAAKRETWTRRAQNLVDKWEMHQRTRGLSVVAGGGEGGIKVYQGWFAGSVRLAPSTRLQRHMLTTSVGSSIDALAPYFSNDSLKADQLFEAIRPSDLPLAYEALADLAHRHHLQDLGEQVHDHQEGERNRREFIARAVVDEVKPVSEVSSDAFE